MFEPQPVPAGLLSRALDTAFSTDSWPEWDELDIVPEFEDSLDFGQDDLDLFGQDDTEADSTAEDPASSSALLDDAADSPAETEEDTGPVGASDEDGEFGSLDFVDSFGLGHFGDVGGGSDDPHYGGYGSDFDGEY